MPRVAPLPRESLSEFEPFFGMIEEHSGFLPTSLLTMGRNPAILQAFAALSGAILSSGKLDPGLRSLVSFVASTAAGCNYCRAHTGHAAHRMGVSEEKLQAAFEYDSSPLFDEAERAALRVAHHAALVPNSVEDDHFEALRAHFDEDQIVELVAVISLFGFLNRWNDTMATTLEASPLGFATDTLSASGWQVGKHA